MAGMEFNGCNGVNGIKHKFDTIPNTPFQPLF
jgi:hypothetical protein